MDFDKVKNIKEYSKLKKDLCDSDSWWEYLDSLTEEELSVIKEYDRVLDNRRMKNKRVSYHLLYMYDVRQYLYFMTFTFDDKYIEYCDRSQRDNIKHSIISLLPDSLFILNTDYGSTTNRKHFHAIVASDLKLSEARQTCSYKMGYYSIEPVRVVKGDKSSDTIVKLKKYLNKLSNHCIKDSTKSTRIYYNFKTPYENDKYIYFISLFKNGIIDKKTYDTLNRLYLNYQISKPLKK